MKYVLGIDLGTGSLKGLLMNQKGELVATSSADYPLIQIQSGYNEQEPKLWLEAFDKVFNHLKQEVPDILTKLEGISFSGQMHSLVLLDENKEVIRPAILWNDTRTTQQCRRIEKELNEDLLNITKNMALEGFTLPKILWVQENEPENWAKARHILLPKDYLNYYLTGQLATDYSDAAGTLLLDIEGKSWSKKVADTFNIPMEYLPNVYTAHDYVGDIRPELSEKLGLKTAVKVFAGGADNACAAVGSGILSEDVAMASIGTSGVFLSFEGEGISDYQGKLHFFNHALRNQHYSMGVTLSAGHSLTWFKDTFASHLSFDELLSPIADIKPGSEGLLFTPYLVGERTPHVDSQVRGSFLGIDARHQLPHFARAVLEGITFSLKDSQQLMADVADKNFKKIVSVGGGAKNLDWLQMQADIFDAEIIRLQSEQGPGLGAAMLAAIGLDWFDSEVECAKVFVQYKEAIQPIQENVEAYKKAYQRYREVYGRTKDI